jgi:hypothetical protein
MKAHVGFPISVTYKLCVYFILFSSYNAIKSVTFVLTLMFHHKNQTIPILVNKCQPNFLKNLAKWHPLVVTLAATLIQDSWGTFCAGEPQTPGVPAI